MIVAPSLILALIDYDAEAGFLTWRYREWESEEWNSINAGQRACFPASDGYRCVVVSGRTFMAHRVAWVIMTGDWPEKILDHIDGVRWNNTWDNLRQATHGQNSANAPLRSHNTSGLKGVHFKKSTGRWLASITVARKSRHLGYFDTKEEAHEAYMKAARENFGEFATNGAAA